MPPSELDLDTFARKMEQLGQEPPPPDIRSLLHRLFEGQQFTEEGLGKLMAETSQLRRDHNYIASKLELQTTEMTKMSATFEIQTKAFATLQSGLAAVHERVAGNAIELKDIKGKLRESRRKLDDLDGELEDTKTTELRELKAERRKLAWTVVAALITGIIGFMLAMLFKRPS
jgi:chromosome segregation ATPase